MGKKIISTILIICLILSINITAFAINKEDADTNTEGEHDISMVQENIKNEDETSIDTQGLDVYLEVDLTDEEWLELQPIYKGEYSENKIKKNKVKNFAKTKKNDKKKLSVNDKQDASLSSALIKKSKIWKNKDDSRFKLWKKANLTTPKTIYNFDDTIYGYLYGVVNSGHIVGYIVSGASAESPDILEYSLDSNRYLSLSEKEKLYFGRSTGFLYEESGNLSAVGTDISICTVSDKNNLLLENTPTVEEYNAIQDTWDETTTLLEVEGQDKEEPEVTIPQNQPNAENWSESTVKRLQMDTSDYKWRNICSTTTLAMYVDAIGRRIEPALLAGYQPHSIKLNNYFNSKRLAYSDGKGFYPVTRITTTLANYVNSNKLTSNLVVSSFMYESSGGKYTNAQVFNKHKETINKNMPTLVGYPTYSSGGKEVFGAHIMMGIGYTSDNYYVVRDTWTSDNKPMRAFYYNGAGYKFYVGGLSITNKDTSTAWGNVTLRKGDSNFNVKRLKYMLKSLFYNPGTINNTFDATLETAVKNFQKDNGLTADGIVGSNTYKKLKTAHIMKYDNKTANFRVLSKGKKGDDVAQLQDRLGLTPDGIFGSDTETKVKDFQRKHGLTVDGQVGSATFKKLVYG